MAAVIAEAVVAVVAAGEEADRHHTPDRARSQRTDGTMTCTMAVHLDVGEGATSEDWGSF